MACNVVKILIEGEALHAVPYGGVSEAEAAVLRNALPMTRDDEGVLIDALLHKPELVYIDEITRLLRVGRDPRRIIDTIQIAAAEIELATQGANNFSMPMHCYEYCNTVGWFFDTFAHPRRLRFLYVAGAFVNMTAWHQKHTGELNRAPLRIPSHASNLDQGELIERIETAVCALDAADAVGLTLAYIDRFNDAAPLIQTLALAATRLGNDPHNQEIAQCYLEDFAKNRSARRGRLLLACAQQTAAHRKYGDPLEASRRFGEAMGITRLQ